VSAFEESCSSENPRPTDVLVDAVQRILEREHAGLACLLEHAVVEAQLLLERQRLAELLALLQSGAPRPGAQPVALVFALTPLEARPESRRKPRASTATKKKGARP